MPNHVTNTLDAPAHVVAAFAKPLSAEEIQNIRTDAQKTYENLLERRKDVEAGTETMDYVVANIETWITRAKQTLDQVNEDPPTHHLSFEGVVPTPADIETGGCGGHGGSFVDTDVAPGEHEEDGTICWYKWNTRFWGTKWDMYDTSLHLVEATAGSDDEPRVRLRFDTAWSSPTPIFEALAAQFPDDDFAMLFADENTGSNYGWHVHRSGSSEAETVYADAMISDHGVNVAVALCIRDGGPDLAGMLHDYRDDMVSHGEDTNLPAETDDLERLAQALADKVEGITGVDLCARTSEITLNDLVAMAKEFEGMPELTSKASKQIEA